MDSYHALQYTYKVQGSQQNIGPLYKKNAQNSKFTLSGTSQPSLGLNICIQNSIGVTGDTDRGYRQSSPIQLLISMPRQSDPGQATLPPLRYHKRQIGTSRGLQGSIGGLKGVPQKPLKIPQCFDDFGSSGRVLRGSIGGTLAEYGQLDHFQAFFQEMTPRWQILTISPKETPPGSTVPDQFQGSLNTFFQDSSLGVKIQQLVELGLKGSLDYWTLQL